MKKWDRAPVKIFKKAIVPRSLATGLDRTTLLEVEYLYDYKNVSYTGNKVFLVELVKGKKGMLTKYNQKFSEKIGDQSLAYVNPGNPAEAVLFCDGIFWYLSAVSIGFVMLLIGLVMLLG